MFVSGVGPVLAKTMVDYRNSHGPFKARQHLMNVPRFGPKVFEQCAGFLRIQDGEHPLDASGVHPESYGLVDRMSQDLGCSLGDLLKDEAVRKRIDLKRYISETVGLPTLQDILSELAQPGRDPRQQFEIFRFSEGVKTLDDLKPGMKLPGIVTNITAFGCFVDLGVHLDGLVHVSNLSHRFVKSPADVVKVHQKVQVTVLEVDAARQRIMLSLKDGPAPSAGVQVQKQNFPNLPKSQKSQTSDTKYFPFADLRIPPGKF